MRSCAGSRPFELAQIEPLARPGGDGERLWPLRTESLSCRRSARRSRRKTPRRRSAGSARSAGSRYGRRAARGRSSRKSASGRAPSKNARRSSAKPPPATHRTRDVLSTVPGVLAAALRDAPFVVVQAPAGFGKTTGVHAALAGAADVAWYDAQPWEAGAFVAPLIARVRTLRPDVGRSTLTLAEADADVERLGATFAEELRHVDAPLRIVVDDAHVLGPQFAAFARELARRMP